MAKLKIEIRQVSQMQKPDETYPREVVDYTVLVAETEANKTGAAQMLELVKVALQGRE